MQIIEEKKTTTKCHFSYTGHGCIENKELKSGCGHFFSEEEVKHRRWSNCPYCGGLIEIK